jgi:hypothetical protein
MRRVAQMAWRESTLREVKHTPLPHVARVVALLSCGVDEGRQRHFYLSQAAAALRRSGAIPVCRPPSDICAKMSGGACDARGGVSHPRAQGQCTAWCAPARRHWRRGSASRSGGYHAAARRAVAAAASAAAAMGCSVATPVTNCRRRRRACSNGAGWRRRRCSEGRCMPQ